MASPFLHGSWSHLIGNTIPFIVLGMAIALGGLARVAAVTGIVALVGGLGTWLTAPSNSIVIGASGLIFGYATYLIARGARMAQAIAGDLLVVYVDLGQDESEANQKTLAANIRFAENVGAVVTRLTGGSVAEAVSQFVREKHVTQVVFGRSATRGWKRYFYLSAIHKFLRDAPAVDVHIVTQEAS